MADPKIASGSIEDARRTIKDRLTTNPPDMAEDTDAKVDEKLTDEQDKELRHVLDRLSNRVFVLLLAGYIITGTVLILSGWKDNGFDWNDYVLIALIVSSMGSTTYMFKMIAKWLMSPA